MPSSRQQFGSWAESAAEDFLRGKGFTILARHVTSRYGEIDILAMDGGILVVVEVKARTNQNYALAVEALTRVKLERLKNTISDILQKSYWPEDRVRLDAVTIEPSGIRHFVWG